MPEIGFTARQLAELRRALGLRPGDMLDAAAVLAALDADAIVTAEHERLALGLGGDAGDGEDP